MTRDAEHIRMVAKRPAAPRQMVYEALTDSDKASTWFGFPIGIEPRVGGRFAMGGFDAGHVAKIVDLRSERTMSVDFACIGSVPGSSPTLAARRV